MLVVSPVYHFYYFAHSPEWDAIRQSSLLGWILTPVKSNPSIIHKFPTYIQIGPKVYDTYLDIPVCTINFLLFFLFFAVGAYIISINAKLHIRKTVGGALILFGLIWLATLWNYGGDFIQKVIYIAITFFLVAVGSIAGTHRRAILLASFKS